MRLRRIVVGTVGPDGPIAKEATLGHDLTVVEVTEPEAYALAVRETLTATERTTTETIPFISVEAEHEDIELTVADDGPGGVRMMTRGQARAIPEVLEIHAADPLDLREGGFDAIFESVAEAVGAEGIQLVAPALARLEASEDDGDELGAEERAFLEASARAEKLAAAVRSVDDEMTASVVPDWLWIATGLGGIGVLCTSIAFIYPQWRVIMIGLLGVGSVIGFSLYGWRAFGELKTRARLQDERAELRERREAARAEVRSLAERLKARDRDTDALLLAHSGAAPPRTAPAILAGEITESLLSAITSAKRQVLLFTKDASGAPKDAIVPFSQTDTR